MRFFGFDTTRLSLWRWCRLKGGSSPDVLRRVDLLTEDSDTPVITDIKTSRGEWSPE